jgi:endonuclease/exonuclease/phosphatase family metal-dependent hydrolase
MRWKAFGVGITVLLVALGGLLVLSLAGKLPSGATILIGSGSPVWDPADPLVVATWNIHYGAGPTLERGAVTSRDDVIAHLDAIAAWIKDSKVDIVALQEVDRDGRRSHGIDELEWLRRATGLDHAAWTDTWDVPYIPWPGIDPRLHLGRVRSGQAVLSRFPLAKPNRHALVQPLANWTIYNWFYLHRAVLEVWVELGSGRRLRVYNAHLEAFDIANKESHAEKTREVLGKAGPLVLLLGDMNAVPPEALLRRAFADEPDSDFSADKTIGTLRSIPGLQEVVPTETYTAQERAWFTFPAAEPNRRLDYMFYGSGFRLGTASVPRLERPPSDHLPVIASFGLP